ncbi:fungal-specific transcription factor domain-containing protein [Schizophyllum commune]
MSPHDTPPGGSQQTLEQQLEHRKRKSDRACDFCRKRKSACDGDQIARKSCSNCTINNLKCTYHDTAKRQVISKTYVESLERRIEELEALLERREQLSANEEGESPMTLSSTRPSSPPTPSITQEQMRDMARAMIRTGTRHRHEDLKDGEGVEGPAISGSIEFERGEYNPQDEDITERFRHVQLGTSIFNRFLGKSSTAHLVLKLISLKKQPDEPYRVPATFLNGRRSRYWSARPWECALLSTESVEYDFPEDDLMRTLVDLFFDNVHLYFPVLHRPSFEEGLRNGRHHTDHDFGAIVLCVCALGARYSEDPRVLSEEYDMDSHSGGWKWFTQAEKTRRPIFGAPSLQEIQSYCLSILFMLASSNLMTQHIWTRIGVAIRYIQDVGAHRRTRRKVPTIVDELWNRAAWILVTLDRNLSAILGRNCAMPDEDFDIRYPMDVDDEYWYNPERPEESWKQPADKPSKVACFIQYIKLSRITEVAIRTIYGTNKYGFLKKFMGEGWERDFVQELDSALNQWMDEMPRYLQWDPEQPDHQLMNQAVFLHCSYRQTQILIHRPFITAHPLAANPSFPSLTICTTAARACAHILDQQKRKTGAGLPYVMFAASVSAIVLLVSMWTRVKPRSPRDQLKELKDIHLLMDYLKSMEDRWVTAGRTWDVLDELCSIGELPNSQLGKRSRDGADDASSERPNPNQHTKHDEIGYDTVHPCRDPKLSAEAMGPSQFAQGPVDICVGPMHHSGVGPPPPPMQNGLSASTMFGIPTPDQIGYPAGACDAPPVAGMSNWFSPQAAGPSGMAGTGMGSAGRASMDSTAPRGSMDSMGSMDSLGGRGSMHSATSSMDAGGFVDSPPGWGSFGEMTSTGFTGSPGLGEANQLDPDGMTIWQSVPPAFDPNDWVTYLAGLAEVANNDQNGQPAVQQMGGEDTVVFPTSIQDGPGSNFYMGNPSYPSFDPSR